MGHIILQRIQNILYWRYNCCWLYRQILKEKELWKTQLFDGKRVWPVSIMICIYLDEKSDYFEAI